LNKAEFLRLIETILEKQTGSVSLDDSLDGLGWDSLAHLSLIAELDRRPDFQVDLSLLSGARTVSDLHVAISPVG